MPRRFRDAAACWRAGLVAPCLLVVAGCADAPPTTSLSPNASDTPMTVTSPIPNPPSAIAEHPLDIAITRRAVIRGRPDQVFAFIAAEDVLPKLLTGYGPLPAVQRTAEHTGPWTVPGSARRVHLADGSTVREQLTLHAPPSRFAYRVWDFGHPLLGALATEARGAWTFAPDAGGTAVTWTYTFRAKNAVAAWPLAGITRWLWRGYMDVCLDNAQRLMAEATAAD